MAPILADYTTNRTLEDEAERLKIPLHFCWHQTSFTKPKKNGGYIINLAPQGKPGTHWTCLWKDRDQIAYFDPFGFYPPEEVEERIGKYYYNEKVVQDPSEGMCGGYCIAFLEFMNESKGMGSVKKRFQTFINLFNPNFKFNKKVAIRLLTDD
jgi:hypothetical protein